MRVVGLVGVVLLPVVLLPVVLLPVVLLALGITGCARRAPVTGAPKADVAIETGYWPDPDKCLGVVDGKYVALVPCVSSKETQ